MKNRLGRKIQELRTARGLTLEDLADKLNLSVGHLSNFENGRRIPRLEMFQKIAKYFQIEYKDLLDITEEKDTKEQEPLILSDEESDRFLADSLYLNNPGLVEDAIREKEEILRKKGFIVDLKEFIEKNFPDQIEYVSRLIAKGKYYLLGLMKQLALNHISECIYKQNIKGLTEARKSLGEFLQNVAQDKKNENIKVFLSLQTIYEISCRIDVYWTNEEKYKRPDNEIFRRQLEKKRKQDIPVQPRGGVLIPS